MDGYKDGWGALTGTLKSKKRKPEPLPRVTRPAKNAMVDTIKSKSPITEDAVDAFTGTLKVKAKPVMDKLNEQDFGSGDSMIASSVMHPMRAMGKGIDWLREQLSTAAGMPTGEQDEGSMYQMGNVNPEARAMAGLNLAGLAQMGSMPMAPPSAGGTLGTIVSRGNAGRGNYTMPEGTGMSSGNLINGPTYGADFKNIYGGQFKNIDEVRNTLTNQLPGQMKDKQKQNRLQEWAK